MPAQLTTTSNPPSCSEASATARSTESWSVTSQAMIPSPSFEVEAGDLHVLPAQLGRRGLADAAGGSGQQYPLHDASR